MSSPDAKPILKPRWWIAVTVLVTVLALVGEAPAQTPDDSSAVDQYVEDVPAGGGSTPVGKDKPKQTRLPKGIDEQVDREGGSDATALRRLATSSGYGAPQKRLNTSKKGIESASPREGMRRLPDAATDASAREAASAAADVVSGGSSGRLLLFLLALFVVSVGALAAVTIQQRRRFTQRARTRAKYRDSDS